MRAVDIIMKKRDGGELSRDGIASLIDGYVSGAVPDYQVSAWAMAVYFKGMTPVETADLTDVMLRSGKVMDLSGISGPFVDKHSTGGVGDKVSLVLAPMVAACGVKVPMMSGRALGHTGGTLDKLESIPGYRTSLSEAEFREFLGPRWLRHDRPDLGDGARRQEALCPTRRHGHRRVGAPHHRLDTLQEGGRGGRRARLRHQVRAGRVHEDSRASGGARPEPRGHGDGDGQADRRRDHRHDRAPRPQGRQLLRGRREPSTASKARARRPHGSRLSPRRLDARRGRDRQGRSGGRALCRNGRSGSGIAHELFLANVRSQGGRLDRLAELRGTMRAAASYDVLAPTGGYIASIDAYKIGLAGVYLGVGRDKTTDPVYPDVGFIFKKKKGDAVLAGEAICAVYGKDRVALERRRRSSPRPLRTPRRRPRPVRSS